MKKVILTMMAVLALNLASAQTDTTKTDTSRTQTSKKQSSTQQKRHHAKKKSDQKDMQKDTINDRDRKTRRNTSPTGTGKQ